MRGKWIRGYGTKLVWSSSKSTFIIPSKRRDAVMDDMTRLRMRLKWGYDGRSISKLLVQMSYMASLSTMNEQPAYSMVECVDRMELYGSTMAADN